MNEEQSRAWRNHDHDTDEAIQIQRLAQIARDNGGELPEEPAMAMWRKILQKMQTKKKAND